MKSKFIVLTTLLAVAVLLPVGFVAADFYFDMTLESTKTDGTGSFTGLNGAADVQIFTNSSTSSTFAVVAGHLDDAVTLIDISEPSNPVVIDTLGDRTAGVKSGVDHPYDGVRNIALFGNDSDTSAFTCTTDRCEVLGIVTNYESDGVAILNFSAPSDRIYFLSNYTQTANTPKVGFPSNQLLDYLQVDSPQSGTINGSGETASALDGAFGVATWQNSTNNISYAIVTGYIDYGITVFNMTNPAGQLHVSMNITDPSSTTPGTDRPQLEMEGITNIETFYIPQDSTGLDPVPYAIYTGFIDDGVQILDLSDPEHHIAHGAKVGYPSGSGSNGGIVAAGIHSNATDGDDGFELLNGAIDVAVWNTTASNHYAIVVANIDNAFTILDISDPTAKLFENQIANGSGQYGSNWNITNPSAVTVFEADDDHYIAAIATNGTLASSISLVDLYEPTNPQPITTVISDGIAGSDGQVFENLDAIYSLDTFFLGGIYYAAVAGYDDDGFTIIQLNGDKPGSGGASKICGYNYDCEPPSVSKSGGSIEINNAALDTSTRYNDVDTTTSKVGKMITVTANVYDEQAIYKSNLYFDFSGPSPDWNDANAAIKYTPSSGDIEIMDNNDIFSADVESNKVGDVTEIKFKIMFTGPMDLSHMAIQNIDDSTNYQLLYFKDALEVTGQSTGATPTSADDTLDEEVMQVIATVPDWVKNTAGWWAEGAISEGEFVKGVEFLIKQQIINTDAQTASSEGTGASVPDWVKNTAGWWADGAISEGEFVNAIEHLVKTGTIIII